MDYTIGSLKKWLEGFDDNEIFIGQIWLAEDFDVDGKTPNQDLITELNSRFWRDSITRDTHAWLEDVLIDIVNEKGTN